MNYNIIKYESLDSTNIRAREIALEVDEGTVVIAEEQRAGRGRMGRGWISPRGKGLWMSIILKPAIPLEAISKITLLGAAAVNKGLMDMGIESKIKWPNDIVIEGRKVCGILTEMNTSMAGINYVIIGIGINVNQGKEDFPEELLSKAGSIKILVGQEIDKGALLENILKRFKDLYLPFREGGDISSAIKTCVDNSAVIGREVFIIDPKGKSRRGLALDMDREGRLVVEFPEGIETIFYGEVSVRGLDGYI